MRNSDTDRGTGFHAGRVWFWYAVNAVLLLLTVLVPVWLRALDHGYHNYDLGIFAQALNNIRLGDLNPFLPATNLPLFNDHFDPILLFFALPARLIEPVYVCLTVEHVFVLLTPMFVIDLCRRRLVSTPVTLFSISYLLFNRGVTSALQSPVHPTTWGMFFAAALTYAVITRSFALEVASSLLLMSCKEEFPFAILVLAGYRLLTGERKRGAVLALLSAAWLIAALGLRPMLVGPTREHGARVLAPLAANPLGLVTGQLLDPKSYSRLLECLAPLLPLFFWQVRRRVVPNLWAIVAPAPLLAIRFLAGAWKFHYMAPVTALLAAAIHGPREDKLLRTCTIIAILATFITAAHPVKKGLKEYGRLQTPSTEAGPRITAIEDARKILLQNPAGRALVGANLTPMLARRPEVYQVGGVQEADAKTYRYVLVEQPPAGDPWPLQHADVEKRIRRWRDSEDCRIIRDDDILFFAEGTFTDTGK